MFISNHVPRVGESPLSSAISKSNFTLQQATRSVGRALGKVFELSMFEHFVNRKGRIIRPADLYFAGPRELTSFGCMIFRECLMRESGIKSYWFD